MNIIDGRQKKRWRAAEMLATFFGWVVMIGLTVQILLSVILWLFNGTYIYNELFIFGKIDDSVYIFSRTLLIALFSFILLYLWGKYNYRRYGKLDRRRFPQEVTSEELAEHFKLPIAEVEKFASEKRITLERNIL